jgi:hypothetical protein
MASLIYHVIVSFNENIKFFVINVLKLRVFRILSLK